MSQEEVLAVLCPGEKLLIQEIADRAGLTNNTTRWNLSRAYKQGLVKREPTGHNFGQVVYWKVSV